MDGNECGRSAIACGPCSAVVGWGLGVVVALGSIQAMAAGSSPPNAVLTIDQNRVAVVDKIVADRGSALIQSGAGLTAEQVRAMLMQLRADQLLAASMAGTLDGVRDVLARSLVGNEPINPALLQPVSSSSTGATLTKAIGDPTDDVDYTPVTPCRLVETRGTFAAVYQGDGTPAHTASPFSVNEVRTYTVQGGNSVCLSQLPSGLAPVAVQLQVFGIPANGVSGSIEILPQGATFGSTATEVFIGSIAFNTVSTTTKINITNNQISVKVTGGKANLAMDVVGYFRVPGNYGGTQTITGLYATDGGGTVQSATGDYSTVVGGGFNQAEGYVSSVFGSSHSVASGDYATVIGGSNNNAAGQYSSVLDGYNNSASGVESSVLGGDHNQASGDNSVIGGGEYQTASGIGSFIGNGGVNKSTAFVSVIVGGTQNEATGDYSSVLGGTVNFARGQYSAVGGGNYNRALGVYSLIAGGSSNTASGTSSSVLGGGGNNASGNGSAIVGGGGSFATGTNSTVLGGNANIASGNWSIAAGRSAAPDQDYCVVFSLWETDTDMGCAGSESIFRIGAINGLNVDYGSQDAGGSGTKWVNIGTGGSKAIDTSTGAYLSTGGTWTNNSDRNAKIQLGDIDVNSILDKLASLPISTWRYKSEEGQIHLGPMAQDFHAAFGLGADERHIATIDEDGVALAAIQGLYAKLLQADAKLTAKDAELRGVIDSLNELKAEVAKIRAMH
jgi:hypothetical protein